MGYKYSVLYTQIARHCVSVFHAYNVPAKRISISYNTVDMII